MTCKSIKHVGTSWTLFCKQQLRYLGRNNLQGKYFHISNCIFTMKGWTDKKIILRCFFTTGLFCLHEKFQVYQSSPSRFSFKKCIFLLYLWGKYFSCKIFTVLHQSKKSHHIWTKKEQKLSNYFLKKIKLLNAMEGCIVQCYHASAQAYLETQLCRN